MVICLLIAWVWLMLLYLGPRSVSKGLMCEQRAVTFQSVPEIQNGDIDEAASCVTESHGVKHKLKLL